MKQRILELSYKHKLSHIGSCLTAVDIIDEIFEKKAPEEKFVLSCGHAALALYVVLEKYGFGNAEDKLLHHGVHPDRCESCNLDCSAGSLGHGLPIAVGMAIANRSKNVYCLISDGECAEGSIYEALNLFEELRLDNLHIYVNCNGWGAYKQIDKLDLQNVILAHVFNMRKNVHFRLTCVEKYPFLKGNDAHYYIMTETDYEKVLR
jgi:transketolase